MRLLAGSVCMVTFDRFGLKKKANKLIYMLQRLLTARRKKIVVILIGFMALIPLAFLTLADVLIAPNKQHILSFDDESSITHKNIAVGIVLGAGVSANGKPYRELQSRLDVAADALNKGFVDKLILSGDNRFDDYNEPQAMVDYLVNFRDIDLSKLQADYAGRSSYESCERAARVFDVKQIIIFSAQSHLSRAIFLCRHFDIEAYGIASEVEANNSRRREILARGKAVFNVYIYGEKTLLGDPINL